MPLCPMTEDCLGPEETLTEGTQRYHMSSPGLGYCICYYFVCHPYKYREVTSPWPFMEEANVEACNLFATFIEFVGTREARKLLTEAEKGWVCWMKFGLPSSVTPIIHKKPQRASDKDLSVLNIQLAWKGTPSVAKLWSTLYGWRGLMKTIFKPSNLRPILHLMNTLPDGDDTEPGPMVPESTSISDRDLHTHVAQELCLQVSEITEVVLFHSSLGSHQNSPLMLPCSTPISLGSPSPTSHPTPPHPTPTHHHPPPTTTCQKQEPTTQFPCTSQKSHQKSVPSWFPSRSLCFSCLPLKPLPWTLPQRTVSSRQSQVVWGRDWGAHSAALQNQLSHNRTLPLLRVRSKSSLSHSTAQPLQEIAMSSPPVVQPVPLVKRVSIQRPASIQVIRSRRVW